ncbi:hypothetical protein MTsPCn9_34480 [Croceitalea sp. MTPC9]|uniref:addiction module protein n=1 Tax=unclassified Croceitalea TaxID=2632280 RepID=UPI002B3952B1|nr:hypothetical protein MTsPCn6_34470 [Croceitalea sp. MTPC6]GMN18508.1 hypothetical protein MTsPCn9_34480 [Croceitalea sp. MTPC9]
MDIQDIKKIPRAKRILLVQEIWDSLEHKEDLELSDEVKAELDHRLARHESGEATYFSLEEVREKLAKLRK